MPTKRMSPPSDAASEVAEIPVKKTHRTHEENQERAYIAASRRADRPIDQRMRSAFKASECRKKRTGRGLKITEKAVLGDEQYESDDEEDTGHRGIPPSNVSAAGSTSAADRYEEVNALFAQTFPNVQLCSRWPAPARQQQPSYQVPLQLQASYIHHYPPVDAATSSGSTIPRPATSGPSATITPLLTPPISQPLAPVFREEESGSMSPLTLERSPAAKPASTVSQAPGITTATTTTAPTSLGLGVGMIDPCAAPTGYMLGAQQQSLPNMQRTEYLYVTTSGRTNSVPLIHSPYAVPSVYGGAGGSSDNASVPGPSMSSGWGHMRSFSLPNALESLEFPSFDFPAATTATVGMTEAGIPATMAAPAPGSSLDDLIDPAFKGQQLPDLSSSLSLTDPAGTAPESTVAPPGDWTQWLNLDGDTVGGNSGKA
ncbi:hypothetical protein C8A03DRAFT_10908 [Achaetomium macrosporum]|uniref:Uncharacterized protein n=1 Tax=Achaetomium macrosporum TaxID=79813 RepID=A0AAN7HI54_9PEZI|nr:hypothetical protein C8A03DRAFT_10908 [Achaetomium macrosporum]